MISILDIPYKLTGSEELMLDAYFPEYKDFTTLVWFHGGGLENGSRKRAVDVADAVTGRGYGLVSVEYRMYPNAHFPEFIEDAAESTAYVLKHCRTWGGSGKVIVVGRSAGAYIAMMLCMNHQYLQSVGVSQEQIVGYITDSAQQFCHFNVLREMGIDPRLERMNEGAPIYYVTPGLSIRPLRMMYYADDIKCRKEETHLMLASIRNNMPDADVQLLELPGKHCCNIDMEFEKICDFADEL